MAGFSLLGQLAGGYMQAAERERSRQFEAETQQRQNMLGLGKMLLENPNTPAEYRGPIGEWLMQVANTKLGQKTPSFDKLSASLPARMSQPQTQPYQVPSFQIGMPSQPPQPQAMGTGQAQGAPSLTQSATAANGGTPSYMTPPPMPPGVPRGSAANIPSMQTQAAQIPEVAPPPLPAGTAPTGGMILPERQATATLAPQQIAPAGRFTMLTPQELAQQQAQAANTMMQTQIQGLKDQGFTDEQIAEKLGMSKWMGIPFGGAFNMANPNQVVSPINTPMTKTQYMVNGKGPFFGFTSRAGGPILDANTMQPVPDAVPFNQAMNIPVRAWSKDNAGNFFSMLVDKQTNQPIPGTMNRDILPPPGYLPSIKQGEFTFVDQDNNVFRIPTTSVTTKGIGGTAGGASPAGAGVTQVKPSGKAKGGATSAPASTPASAPNQGARFIGTKAPTGATKSRADAAEAIMPLIDQAEKMLQDPEVVKNMGPVGGRWSELQNRVGTMSGPSRELASTLMSIYSLAGTMHGWKALQVAKEFAGTYGDIKATPDSLRGGLEAMRKTANSVYATAYKRPIPKTDLTNIEKQNQGGNKSPQDEANEYLKSLGGH